MSSLFALIKSFFKRIIAFFKRSDTTDEPVRPDEPYRPDEPVDPKDIVCYYGCPNSKKARRLQLERKPIR